MKKNKLKSKKINKSKTRIASNNTINQNEVYDVLDNNINTPYTNSTLSENNVSNEEIGNMLPQSEQNTNLTNQNNISNEYEDYNMDEYYLPTQDPCPVIPPGQKMPNVIIKSVYTNTFIKSNHENILYAVETDYNQCENFRIIPESNIHVILRVVGEGYIRINNEGILVADVNEYEATRFIIFRHGFMTFTLLAPNGRFVEIRPRDNILIAECSYANARSLLKFKQINP